MDQVLFRIPLKTPWFDGVPIFGFGVMLCLAFLLCTWLACRRGARVGVMPGNIQDLTIWLFVFGLLGARILHLVQEEHLTDPMEIMKRLPQIWNGGIIFYGSVIGGLVGYLGAWYFIFRKKKVPTLRLADVLAPSIALGLCLGRVGCFLNGCCFGQVACANCAACPKVHFPMSAPPREVLVDGGYQTAAGFTYARDLRPGPAKVGLVAPGSPAQAAGLKPGDVILKANGQDMPRWETLDRYLGALHNWPQGLTTLTLTVQRGEAAEEIELPAFAPRTLGLYPTQLFESISMVLLILLLLAYEPFRRREGQMMAVCMIGYAVHRYLNEMLRDDPRPVGFERYTSVLLFVAGLGLWLWLQLRRRPDTEGVPGTAPAPVSA